MYLLIGDLFLNIKGLIGWKLLIGFLKIETLIHLFSNYFLLVGL